MEIIAHTSDFIRLIEAREGKRERESERGIEGERGRERKQTNERSI